MTELVAPFVPVHGSWTFLPDMNCLLDPSTSFFWWRPLIEVETSKVKNFLVVSMKFFISMLRFLSQNRVLRRLCPAFSRAAFQHPNVFMSGGQRIMPKNSKVLAHQIRSHDFWRFKKFVCMYVLTEIVFEWFTSITHRSHPALQHIPVWSHCGMWASAAMRCLVRSAC